MCDEILLTIGEDGVVREYDDTWDIVIHCESKEEHDAAIKRLTVLESNWIPCSERLPDVGAILLSDGNEIVIGEYYGDNTWKVDGCDYDPILEEIAWMPLPEPYQPKEDES